jgi:hypothetical protein
MGIKRVLSILFPRPVWSTLHSYRVLSIEFGQFKSFRLREALDRNSQPIPWFTYPAIEFLNQLDLSDKTVFEYGSGNSTIFWAQRCRSVVAVEDNEQWYKKIAKLLPSRVDYRFVPKREDYISAISHCPFDFDLIAIDGSHRYECAEAARYKLKNDGFVILDNSDWREKTSQLLRESDLIEIDMSGFGPINSYTWTTSFYFSRNVRLKPAHQSQPVHGIGSTRLSEADLDSQPS